MPKKTSGGAGTSTPPGVALRGVVHVGGALRVGRDLIISLAAATATSSFSGTIEAFLDEYLVSETGTVPFGGRDDDVNRLDNWLLDESAPSRLLLTAPAGRGKSALLVRWIASLQARGFLQNGDGDCWHVIFVPISIRFGTNRPSVFYQALAKRLADIIGKGLHVGPGDSDAHYADQAQTNLRHLVSSGEARVLVVVDGLDEALGARFTADIFPRAPGPRLKIIVSARLEAGDVDAGGWQRRLGWDMGVRVTPLELDPLDTDGVEDVLIKMGAPSTCSVHSASSRSRPFANDRSLSMPGRDSSRPTSLASSLRSQTSTLAFVGGCGGGVSRGTLTTRIALGAWLARAHASSWEMALRRTACSTPADRPGATPICPRAEHEIESSILAVGPA